MRGSTLQNEPLRDGSKKLRTEEIRILRDHESGRLLYGPYVPPDTYIGDTLLCAAHGLQTVTGWYGPRQWPKARTRRGRPQLIVCGDLVRALSLETRETIALHWGVHWCTVANWRRKLGISGTPSAGNIALKKARMRMFRHEEPATWVIPGVTQFKRLSSEELRSRVPRVPGQQAWSPAEIDKLIVLENRRAAAELGRSYSSVANARQRFNVPQPSKACRCRFCHHQWQSRTGALPKLCARCKRPEWQELE